MRTVATGILCALLCLLAIGADYGRCESATEPNFGENGVLSRDVGIGDNVINDIAIQDDGRMVVVGYAGNGAVKNLVVERYLASGEVDTDFNNGHPYTLSLSNGDTVAQSVLLRDDGHIIVAATSVETATSTIALLCLDGSGNGDLAFGDQGVRKVIVDGIVGELGLAADNEGNLVMMATSSKADGSSSLVAAKTSKNGILDTAFGGSGVSVISNDNSFTVNGITMLSGGLILAAGSIENSVASSSVSDEDSGTSKAALLRLTATGAIDTSFGSSGVYRIIGATSDSSLQALQSVSDTSIVAVGYMTKSGMDASLIIRFDADGKLDTGFGENGISATSLKRDNRAEAVKILSDGTILVTGYMSSEDDRDLLLLTLTPLKGITKAIAATDSATTPSKAQYTTEYAIVDIAGFEDAGHALAVNDDGALFVAGATSDGDDLDFLVLNVAELSSTIKSGEAGTSGSISEGYYLETLAISDVTRVSAATGGTLVYIGSSGCQTTCEASCTNYEDWEYDSCYEDCLYDCDDAPTVSIRGVCYSINPNPEYDESAEDTTSSTTDDTTDTTTTSIFPDDTSNAYDLVRSGQTDDGDGTGEYSSDILDVTPATIYYVRAYAVLSDDTVIYGNEVAFKTDDACFIATAAYGSLLDSHVQVLRDFRDRYMLGSEAGQLLVAGYYHYSPALADYIAASPVLRGFVRILLWPVVFAAYLALHTSLLLVVLVICVIMSLPVLRFIQVRHKKKVA